MQYSLNQIEHTVRKAVRGAGLSWGLAEEAGRAVRWLETMALNGVGSLVALLNEVDHCNWQDCAVEVNDHGWCSRSGILSPLVAGPSVCDLIHEPTTGIICLQQVARPVLFLGYAGIVATQSEGLVQVHADDAIVLVGNTCLWIENSSNFDRPNVKQLNISLAPANSAPNAKPQSVEIGAKEIKDDQMAALERYVHRTYVEATEASRMAGAGAGITDND